jgi:hypothetical protein
VGKLLLVFGPRIVILRLTKHDQKKKKKKKNCLKTICGISPIFRVVMFYIL